MSKLIIKNRYATISNEILNREDVSLKAKGLFAYLQSKPDNWNFSKERIAKQLKEGISSIKSAFKELKDNKYLKTIPIKNKDGLFNGYDYLLVDLPSVGKPDRRKTGPAENHTSISKQEYSKQEYSKQEDVAGEPAEHKNIIEIFDLFKEVNPMINYGHTTNRKAIKDLLVKFGKEKLISTIKYATSVQGNKYAPTITTPYQLQTKLGELRVFYKKESGNSTIVKI